MDHFRRRGIRLAWRQVTPLGVAQEQVRAFWRSYPDAPQGMRRSHSELWRRRATQQRAGYGQQKCANLFLRGSLVLQEIYHENYWLPLHTA